MYEPLKVFTYLGLTIIAGGVALGVRFLYYVMWSQGFRHQGSLIAAAVLLILGFLVLVMGLLADVISGNRKLLEDLLYRVRSLETPSRDVERERPALTRATDRADRWEH
jgi:sulfite exporter TauE/SafE